MEDLKPTHMSAQKAPDRASRCGSEIQSVAYSSSRATSSRAARRHEQAISMQEYNKTLREAQMLIQKTQYVDRQLSPEARDPKNYETRLPNENTNYGKSPAAKRAIQDGSLDPMQTTFNRTFNRKLKMRDTFTKIFPSYTHGEDTCYIASATHHHHYYPKRNDLGSKMQDIDRAHTHKKDFMKEYSESMYKIASIRRQF